MTEVPLQIDMFTGEWVDRRTRSQKQHDAERILPVQMLMFPQGEMLQIGVDPHPKMNLSPGRLVLIAEDPRTPEEVEADRLKAAQKMTLLLFSMADPVEPPPADEDEDDLSHTPVVIEQPSEAAKTQALADLQAAVEDITSTLAAAPDVLRAQTIWLAQALVAAQGAGVDTEMVASLLKPISERGAMIQSVTEPGQKQEPIIQPGYSFSVSLARLPFPLASHIAMNGI